MQCEGVQLPARRSNWQPKERAWVAFEPQCEVRGRELGRIRVGGRRRRDQRRRGRKRVRRMRVDGGGVRRWGRKVRLFDRFLEEVEEGWCSSSVMIWGFCSGSKSSESDSAAASPRE